MLANILSALVGFLQSAVEAIILLLPESPFVEIQPVEWPLFMKWVGLFIPFGSMVTHFTIFLGAVLTWYAYRWIIRFTRMIS